MKSTNLLRIGAVGLMTFTTSMFAQLVIDDSFDDGDWESTWIVQHNAVGSTTVEESGGDLVMLNQGTNQNGGVASIESFAPTEQGVQATFVLKGVFSPDTGDLARPTANGLFMGVVANNGAFYRASNNFGLAFFGNENRTASAAGYGLIAGDRNGGTPSDHFFDDEDIDLESFADGCTVNITADVEGWSYKISDVLDLDLNDVTFENSGKWADTGTSFEAVFGDDPEWHIFVSCQSGPSTEHVYESISLSPKEAELSDSDGDGMPDFYEAAHGLNPDLDDSALDPDGDGSSHLTEYERNTDPNNPDSDSDGLSDGAESGTGVWMSVENTGTNPLSTDSDGDDIADGAETNTHVFVNAEDVGTDPNNPDSDGDRSSDGFEVAQGSDPNSRGSLPEFEIATDLIGHWKFDETTGGSVGQSAPFPDLFDFEFGEGELVNFVGNDHWDDGQIGGSLQFGGASDEQWMVVPAYPTPSPDSVTVSAWVWADSLTDGAVIAIHGADNSNPRQFRLAITPNGNQLEGSGRTKNGDVSVIHDTEAFPVNSWQHVAYVLEDYDPEIINGGEARLYRNGELVAFLGTTEGANGGRNEFFSIGALMDADGFNLPLETDPGFWHGRIDDFGLWGRALATEEIVGIYESGILGQDLTNAKAPVPPELPTDLSVAITADDAGGSVSISWETGAVKLQQSTDLSNANGWSDVDGASSPYSEDISGEQKYFRVVLE
ncbi:MAG: hypothetical protein HOH33_18235 [Verrucomicrobia bacterium]|jgi:hypothetical protein|nr:hypothetical protein [Verrucomicrobiota bacterium]